MPVVSGIVPPADKDARAAVARELASVRERLAGLDDLRGKERDLVAELEDTSRELRARVRLPLLDQVAIATPCTEAWDAMVGDERTRHCLKCDKDVHDLSAMTREEAEAFLAETRDACVRIYRRIDGTVMTADCRGAAKRRRTRRIIAATAAAAAAIGAVHALAPERRGSVALTPAEAREMNDATQGTFVPYRGITMGIVRSPDTTWSVDPTTGEWRKE